MLLLLWDTSYDTGAFLPSPRTATDDSIPKYGGRWYNAWHQEGIEDEFKYMSCEYLGVAPEFSTRPSGGVVVAGKGGWLEKLPYDETPKRKTVAVTMRCQS